MSSDYDVFLRISLVSAKILSTGCLPANVLKIFLETLTGSNTGFETSDRGHLPGFYVTICNYYKIGGGVVGTSGK